MADYKLLQVLREDSPPRFYANGRRISRDRYESISTQASMFGHLDCFASKCKPLPGGKFIRRNYVSARIPESQ